MLPTKPLSAKPWLETSPPTKSCLGSGEVKASFGMYLSYISEILSTYLKDPKRVVYNPDWHFSKFYVCQLSGLTQTLIFYFVRWKNYTIKSLQDNFSEIELTFSYCPNCPKSSKGYNCKSIFWKIGHSTIFLCILGWRQHCWNIWNLTFLWYFFTS